MRLAGLLVGLLFWTGIVQAATCSVNNGLVNPVNANIQLNGVAGVPGLVIGVGQPANGTTGVVYVNGVTSTLPAGTNQLNAVSVASSTYAVAVGEAIGGTPPPLIQYNGTTWSAMPTAGTPPTSDVLAVKTYGPTQTYAADKNGIYFFNGTTWSLQQAAPAGANFSGMWGNATTLYGLADNGTVYTKVPATPPSTWTVTGACLAALAGNGAQFLGITGDAAGNIYVTGQDVGNKGFIYKYNPATNTCTNLYTSTVQMQLNGVAVNTATGAITAVGNNGAVVTISSTGTVLSQTLPVNGVNNINGVYIAPNGSTYMAGQTAAACTAAAMVTPASGGGAIPSSSAGGAWTTLIGSVVTEAAVANIGVGTIILNVPAGFVFDIAGIAPTVLITGNAVTATNNINHLASGTAAAITSRSATQITFTVTFVSAGTIPNTLTWQNIRVRPTAATPLATGNITQTGTATGFAAGTNFGSLAEILMAGPDHYELSLPTASLSCLASTAKVTACADTSNPCTNNYTAASGKTATLATNGGTLGATTVTFDATGVASTTLNFPAAVDGTAVSVTLSGEQIAATNLRKCCPDGVSCVAANSCSTTFNTAGFMFSATANGAVATIPNQIAGTSSATYYLRAVKTNTITMACQAALTGAQSVNFAYECNNPTTCFASNLMSVNGGVATVVQGNNNASVASYLPVSMTFDASGNAPFTFNYSDAGQVRLYASKAAGGLLLSTLTGSTNAFVVKPGGFVLSGIMQAAVPNLVNPVAPDAAGAKFVKAGEAFAVTVTATTSGGTVTPNYGQEITPESVKLTSALVAGLGLTNNPAIVGAFGAFTNGVATGSTFSWNEAGIITLTPSILSGNYLASAGDTTGTVSSNVGRFYAAQFVLSAGVIANRTDIAACPAPAGCGAFTYMGEPMSAVFTLTAKALDGTTTLQNYNWSATAANQFAKLNPLAVVAAGTGGPLAIGAVNSAVTRTAFPPCGAIPAHPCLTPALAMSGTFASGVASITVPLTLYRDNATPAGPYNALDIAVAPQDSDGAIMAAYDRDTNAVAGANNHTLVGQTIARYGRLNISNAHGSELLPLPISAKVQYFDGTSAACCYVTNSMDSVTSFAAGTVSWTNCQKLAANSTWPTTCPPPTTVSPATVAFLTGKSSFILAKPGVGNTGSVDMTINAPSYLPSNTARATFGVYKGAKEFIYLRENY